MRWQKNQFKKKIPLNILVKQENGKLCIREKNINQDYLLFTL